MTRISVVVDDALMTEALELTGLRTKQAVIEQALRLLIQLTRRKHVRRLRGKVQWEGNLDQLRDGRFSSPLDNS